MTVLPSSLVVRVTIAAVLTAGVVTFGYSANNYLLQAGTTLAMSVVLCIAWNVVGGFVLIGLGFVVSTKWK